MVYVSKGIKGYPAICTDTLKKLPRQNSDEAKPASLNNLACGVEYTSEPIMERFCRATAKSKSKDWQVLERLMPTFADASTKSFSKSEPRQPRPGVLHNLDKRDFVRDCVIAKSKFAYSLAEVVLSQIE